MPRPFLQAQAALPVLDLYRVVLHENDPDSPIKWKDPTNCLRYVSSTTRIKDLQIWSLSKPLRYTLDQGDLGEREYEVVAEVESGTWGVPPIIRCPLIGGKAGTVETGKGLPLSKWLRKRSYGFTWSS
jgi:hypothetical protein